MIDSTTLADLTSDRAWRELEAKLRPFVAKRVRTQADIDDVMQDIFVKIHRGLSALRDDERFGPWVYQVARSAVIDHARTLSRRTSSTVGPHEATEAADIEPGDNDDDEPSVEQVVAMVAAGFISQLPSPYREALTLTELEGLTQREAARMLGLSLSGMKSRVQRGRQKLRTALEECCRIALDGRRRVISCEPRADGKLPDGCCA